MPPECSGNFVNISHKCHRKGSGVFPRRSLTHLANRRIVCVSATMPVLATEPLVHVSIHPIITDVLRLHRQWAMYTGRGFVRLKIPLPGHNQIHDMFMRYNANQVSNACIICSQSDGYRACIVMLPAGTTWVCRQGSVGKRFRDM